MSLVLMELPTVRCGDMILEQEVMVGVMEVTILYESNRKCNGSKWFT
jgi:hypothetical protein